MEMLARLHELGYQRLRLSSGMSPTGLNWRYAVAPKSQFEPGGYLLKGGFDPGAAFGTTRGEEAPFDWEDAEGLDPEALAELFLARFPKLAKAGLGEDPDYAAWFKSLLEASRPRGAPVMYGDYVDVEVDGYVWTGYQQVPLPPKI